MKLGRVGSFSEGGWQAWGGGRAGWGRGLLRRRAGLGQAGLR